MIVQVGDEHWRWIVQDGDLTWAHLHGVEDKLPAHHLF